jgi:hypothetical protein
MIQASVATPITVRPPPDLLEPLLRLAGDLRNARVLILAEQGIDLMCGLIRRGCLAATTLRFGGKPDAGEYDLVVVPHMAPSSTDLALRLARRSLAPRGRLVVGVLAGKPAAALSRRLRLNGFVGLRSLALPGLMILRAELRRPA